MKSLPMKKRRIGILLAVAAVPLAFISCQKQKSCYDANLEAYWQNRACTTDCPGVTGCDGKTYCNECDANRAGVHVIN